MYYEYFVIRSNARASSSKKNSATAPRLRSQVNAIAQCAERRTGGPTCTRDNLPDLLADLLAHHKIITIFLCVAHLLPVRWLGPTSSHSFACRNRRGPTRPHASNHAAGPTAWRAGAGSSVSCASPSQVYATHLAQTHFFSSMRAT